MDHREIQRIRWYWRKAGVPKHVVEKHIERSLKAAQLREEKHAQFLAKKQEKPNNDTSRRTGALVRIGSHSICGSSLDFV